MQETRRGLQFFYKLQRSILIPFCAVEPTSLAPDHLSTQDQAPVDAQATATATYYPGLAPREFVTMQTLAGKIAIPTLIVHLVKLARQAIRNAIPLAATPVSITQDA